MFEAPGSIQAARYHASTGTFDAPVLIESQPNVVQESSGAHFVVVDSKDHVTIAWGRYVGAVIHTWSSRSFDQGATYGTGQNAGAGVGNEGIYLRAVGPTSTSWSAPVKTNVQTDQGGNYGSLHGSARLLFDTKGHVVLLANELPEAGPNYMIQAVTCSL